MINFTDEATGGCDYDVVFAIDYLDENRDLLSEHVTVDETLEFCGFGPIKCGILLNWVNKRLFRDGKPTKKPSDVSPATTIRKVIGYVC